MKLTENEYKLIENCFPVQRGNVSLSNLDILNAILHVLENGCQWRSLPKYFGNWHTVYTRMNRWAKSGVLDKIFIQLQQKQIITIKIDTVLLDDTGALKNSESKLSGNLVADVAPSFIWLPRVIGLR